MSSVLATTGRVKSAVLIYRTSISPLAFQGDRARRRLPYIPPRRRRRQCRQCRGRCDGRRVAAETLRNTLHHRRRPLRGSYANSHKIL